MFRAVILLSVPYGARTEGAVKPTEAMRKRAPAGQQFYQTYFQTPGVAEKEFDVDPKRTLRMFLYSLSGSIPKEHKWRYRRQPDASRVRILPMAFSKTRVLGQSLRCIQLGACEKGGRPARNLGKTAGSQRFSAQKPRQCMGGPSLV